MQRGQHTHTHSRVYKSPINKGDLTSLLRLEDSESVLTVRIHILQLNVKARMDKMLQSGGSRLHHRQSGVFSPSLCSRIMAPIKMSLLSAAHVKQCGEYEKRELDQSLHTCQITSFQKAAATKDLFIYVGGHLQCRGGGEKTQMNKSFVPAEPSSLMDLWLV